MKLTLEHSRTYTNVFSVYDIIVCILCILHYFRYSTGLFVCVTYINTGKEDHKFHYTLNTSQHQPQLGSIIK